MRCLTALLLFALCPTLSAQPPTVGAVAPVPVRVATFNIAMGFEEPGEMAAALESGDHPRLRAVAEILQRVRPDVVLLNEFDFDPAVDAARLLNERYLGRSRAGQQPLRYAFHYRAAVNTGVDSGLDLDGDGQAGGPGDAWGFGRFPGQYGMLVLSRFPIRQDTARSFQHYRWSALPGALRPVLPDGSAFYDDETWGKLRLSSKSHWDLAIDVGGRDLHLLAHHPTPPVFDGAEDRNGRRNFDEIRFWREYTDPSGADYLVDDAGAAGGLGPGSRFVIAGDFNADPADGDSRAGAIAQLLEAPWIDARCVPRSTGGAEAARVQGGANREQRGDAGADTADFDDRRTGNLRLDYLLPSGGLLVTACGVFWPSGGEPGREAIEASDHRLVWLDLLL